MIPAKTPVKGVVKEVVDEDDEDEDDEDEYRVEMVVGHGNDEDTGVVIYQIKWLGYDAEGDLTWEPLENLYVRFTVPASELLRPG